MEKKEQQLQNLENADWVFAETRMCKKMNRRCRDRWA